MSEAVPFSAKIDAEIKEKLNNMAEQSGMTMKDFLSRLVGSYETAQERESMGQVKEIENLRHHLARVEEIYVSIVKAAKDRQESDAERIAKAEAEAQMVKAEALDREKQAAMAIDSANERVHQADAEAALVREQANQEIAQLKEIVEREKEAREQSARLAALAEQAAAAAKTKAEQLADQASKADQYQKEKEELEKQLDQTKELLKQTQVQAKNNLDREITQSKDLLERTKERAEVEKEKAVLLAQREFMEEIGRLRESHAQCREEKAALEIKLSQLEQQIQKLKDENVAIKATLEERSKQVERD